MAWRNSLDKGKYKTKARKKNHKIGKILVVLFLLCAVFVAFYATGTLQNIYDKFNPAAEKIIETKIIEKKVVEPIIVDKTEKETIVIMPEGNWYKYDNSNSNYKPVSEMKELIDQLELTGKGQNIINKTEPRFESETEIVAQDVSLSGEDVYILGLWQYQESDNGNTRSEEIMMLKPNDELYDQVGTNPKVILMHELLHSIDYNDDSFDADDFGDDLAKMYPEVYDEINSLGYPKEQINDELFARVGSEKAKAPANVKKIYAQYFEIWSKR